MWTVFGGIFIRNVRFPCCVVLDGRRSEEGVSEIPFVITELTFVKFKHPKIDKNSLNIVDIF